MPTSAPGSDAPAWHRRRLAARRPSAGFTLIELLLVVALVAVASGLVSLAIRDPSSTRLEQEATRLVALLESARAESRATGVPVRWVPLPAEGAGGGPDFRFQGLPKTDLPLRWLDREVRAEVIGGNSLLLGPEPVIGAQRVALRLAERRLDLATDGLAPFAVAETSAEPAAPGKP